MGKGVNERKIMKANMMCIAQFLYFADRASRCIRVMKANLMHYLSSVYFFNQPLQVLGIL